MSETRISSREFNQNRSSATKAMKNGPVIITDRGKPSFVLMSYTEFKRISEKPRSLADALSMPGLEDIDLESVIDRPKSSSIRTIDFD